VAKPRVYLDHVASAPMDPAAREAVVRALADLPGNPSSPHLEGRAAKDALEAARTRVAAVLGCRAREVVFTASGTEAAQIGLRGAALARRSVSRRVVLSAAEHTAVREAAEALAGAGFEALVVGVDGEGRLDADAFAEVVGTDCAVAAVLLASHETGAVLPVAPLGAALRERGIPLLCDAAMGPGRLPVGADAVPADLLVLSGHKFGGPKGSGVLRVRRGTRLERVLTGGLQEERLRPGTEDVAAAIGLAVALERAAAERPERAARHDALRDEFLEEVRDVPDLRVLGPRDGGLPGVVAFEVRGVEGEALMINMDLEGFAISTGSTCALGAAEASPGLLALGLDARRAASTVRVSFGEGNTPADARAAGATFRRIVERLRSLARR
jgi:cysteine desulfurase